MGDVSLSKVLATWIDEHTWPPEPGLTHSILVIPAVSPDGNQFVVHSAFSYFQIVAGYDKVTDVFTDLTISLFAPTNAKSVVVATVDSYYISHSDGREIKFNLDNGYIKGTVFFKYNDSRHIVVTYAVDLPYAGRLEDSLDISPTEAKGTAGLTPGHLKAIQPLETYKAQNALVQTKTVDSAEQELFVKYVKDFTKDEHIAVVTYYEGRSLAYEITIPLLPFLELVLSIDPTTLSASATLYAVLPWPVGRVRLAGVSGSLITGIDIGFNVAVANGSVRIWATKGSSGHYELWAEGSGWVLIYGDWKFGPTKFITLPF